MMEGRYSPEHEDTNPRVPEARYAYYWRCQVFRKGGEQCKAPAEKGAHICHAHAGQQATALRRERERQAVLAEAVMQMRQRGKPDCEAADLFMDFNGIQVTMAVMAQAVIDGRIDCKTAGRLVVQLQTMAKLLRVYHRGHSEAQRSTTALTTKDATEHKSLPQSYADQSRIGKAQEWQGSIAVSQRSPKTNAVMEAEKNRAAKLLSANQDEETRIALVAEVREIADRGGWSHAPPELLRAA
ncbi:MAG TPA: hypothetical protein VGQ12_17425 [Candidatus Angelobacter sp.]|jgi:hypothetical protein|nr:hypothetical protein [Candidatus Angelobacter sp.]